jgi:hypothetical protein
VMDFTWYILGVLTGAAGIFLWRLSKQYRLTWLLWGGLTVGIFLILFSMAWSVGAVLGGTESGKYGTAFVRADRYCTVDRNI